MRTSKLQILTMVTAFLCVLTCGCEAPDDGLVEDLGTLMPGEPVVPEVAETAPDNVTVLFADDLVHVSSIILRSGESIPEIEAGHRLYLQPVGSAELAVDGDEGDSLIHLQRGEVRYVEPGAVSITNVAELPIELIEVARTSVMMPEFLDSQDADTQNNEGVIFSNDRVRVHEMTLEPGETVDLPATPIRVVYPMNDADLEYRSAAGEAVTIPAGPSNPHARPGDDVSVSNLSDDVIDLVVFDWLK